MADCSTDRRSGRFCETDLTAYGVSRAKAHWHLVPANNKPFSRLAAFRIIVDRLSKGVALEPPALDPRVAAAAEQFLGIELPPGTRAAR